MPVGKEFLALLISGTTLMTKRASAPHPPWWGRLIRHGLSIGFPLAGRIFFDLKVEGVENFKNSPGTLVVANHKTDFDIVLLGPTLYWSHHGRGPGGRIAFVAAERMFQRGYFSDYLLPKPRWLSRLLYPANLSAVLKAIRAYPIGYLRVRKLKAHLWAILETEGDIPIGDALARPVEEIIPGVPPSIPISRLLRFRYHEALDREWGFSILAPTIRRRLRAKHVKEIIASLSRFAAILDEGDALYLAPEGHLETDGRFEEAKAGLIRLVEMARDPVILPVNLTYDFMTTGRARVFLTIGKELHGVKDWPRQRLEREIIQRISRLGTITFSQLAAVSLRALASRGDEIVHAGELKQAIIQRALRLIDSGYRVDLCLLSPKEFKKRWRRFVSYCQRHELLEIEGGWLLYDPAELFGDESPERANAWVYAANEYAEITEETKAPEGIS